MSRARIGDAAKIVDDLQYLLETATEGRESYDKAFMLRFETKLQSLRVMELIRLVMPDLTDLAVDFHPVPDHPCKEYAVRGRVMVRPACDCNGAKTCPEAGTFDCNESRACYMKDEVPPEKWEVKHCCATLNAGECPVPNMKCEDPGPRWSCCPPCRMGSKPTSRRFLWR